MCKGKRRTKSSGTCKIDKNCTATFKVLESSDGSITVEVNHTHYGHQIEVQHLKISKRHRQEIAAKLR